MARGGFFHVLKIGINLLNLLAQFLFSLLEILIPVLSLLMSCLLSLLSLSLLLLSLLPSQLSGFPSLDSSLLSLNLRFDQRLDSVNNALINILVLVGVLIKEVDPGSLHSLRELGKMSLGISQSGDESLFVVSKGVDTDRALLVDRHIKDESFIHVVSKGIGKTSSEGSLHVVLSNHS